MKTGSSKKYIFVTLTALAAFFVLSTEIAHAFWMWTPQNKKLINAKYIVKDTPEDQYNWAMRFYEERDLQRAADEFVRLCSYYPDSDLAPEAQYYAGRAYEEMGKYYPAFQNYQKTIDNYPYTKRQDELIERQYNIANIFQSQEGAKIMALELSLSIDKAVEVYKKVVDNAPFGTYADQALMKMAECYRRMKRFNEAVEAYEKIINDHPDSKFVTEAKYQLAYTRYEASLNPEYDQESTDQAIKQFKKIKEGTAVPSVAQETGKLVDALMEKKAESLVKIAQFYEKQGRTDSAVIYYKQIVENYPNTKSAAFSQKKVDELSKKGKKLWGIW